MVESRVSHSQPTAMDLYSIKICVKVSKNSYISKILRRGCLAGHCLPEMFCPWRWWPRTGYNTFSGTWFQVELWDVPNSSQSDLLLFFFLFVVVIFLMNIPFTLQTHSSLGKTSDWSHHPIWLQVPPGPRKCVSEAIRNLRSVPKLYSSSEEPLCISLFTPLLAPLSHLGLP